MRKYHVYGIGNALVDYEFKCDPQFLQDNEIDKGLMTLIDDERETALRKTLSGQDSKRACGGSAANTMIAVSQFGGESFYSCKVANDEPGDFYTQDLVNEGVKNNLHNEREEGVTGKCLVFVTPDADRTMNTYLGITQNFSTNELVEAELKQSDYLYIEGYLVTSPNSLEAALKAKQIAEDNDVKTALTFSDPNMVNFFKTQMKDIIGNGLDLLFCNEDEALTFFETDNLETAKEEMKKIAKTFVITRGPQGALIYDGNDFLEVSGHKVEAVDTNGAGDLFAGSFLYGITHGMNYFEAGELATKASAKLVTQFGPRLTKNQVVELK